jgi:ankyrin repeat protein
MFLSSITSDTPLHQVSNKRYADGVVINTKGEGRPLHLGSGHYDVAKLLLYHGAEVSAVINDGETPLHQALKREDSEMAKLFIDCGADLSVTNNDGETPLQLTSKWVIAEVAKELLDRGVDVSVLNSDGETTSSH